jgi:hypothetical protein
VTYVQARPQASRVPSLGRIGIIGRCIRYQKRYRAERIGELPRCPDRHLGQVDEAVQVSGDDLSSSGSGSGGDEEVVRATRPAAATDVGQQCPVHPGDVEVVGLDRDRVQYGRDERGATTTPLAVGQLDPDRQLGRGDRGDRHVVLVAD